MNHIFEKYEILLLLWYKENQDVSVRETMRGLEISQFAIMNNSSNLMNLGLLDEKIGKHRAKIYNLTDKGKQVAIECQSFMLKIEEIINS